MPNPDLIVRRVVFVRIYTSYYYYYIILLLYVCMCVCVYTQRISQRNGMRHCVGCKFIITLIVCCMYVYFFFSLFVYNICVVPHSNAVCCVQ